jgi:hypothetical protein
VKPRIAARAERTAGTAIMRSLLASRGKRRGS